MALQLKAHISSWEGKDKDLLVEEVSQFAVQAGQSTADSEISVTLKITSLWNGLKEDTLLLVGAILVCRIWAELQ